MWVPGSSWIRTHLLSGLLSLLPFIPFMLDRASLWLQWFPANRTIQMALVIVENILPSPKRWLWNFCFCFWQMLHDFRFLHSWKITRIYVFNSNSGIFVSLICTFTAKRARLYVYGRDLGASQNSQGLVEFHSTVATVISQIPGGTAILGRNFSQGSDTDTYPYTRRGRWGENETRRGMKTHRKKEERTNKLMSAL